MQEPEESYTLEDYVSAMKRRRRVLYYVAFPIAVVAFAIAASLPNEYASVARIAINLEGSSTRTLEPLQVSAYADQYIAELRDRVMTTKNLQPFVEDPENFPVTEKEFPISDRLGLLRSGFFFALTSQPVMSQRGSEVDIISGFRTGYYGPDPEFAFKVSKFLAQSFMQQDRQRRTQQASSTSDFLAEQIRETEQQFTRSEQEMTIFKTTNACCLPELKELNMTIIQRAERDIETLQPRIRSLEQNRQFLQSQIEEVRRQTGSRDRLALLEAEYISLVANYGADHPDVVRVRRQIQAVSVIGSTGFGNDELANLRAQLAESKRRYSDIHPDVIALTRRIESLESGQTNTTNSSSDQLIENPRFIQLRSEMNSVDTELAELRARVPELRDRIDEYEQRLTRTPHIESEYFALDRKIAAARNTIGDLQKRLVTAQQTQALESTAIGARLSQIRAAGLPTTPTGPPRLAILMLGAFLAVTMGIGATILAEMLDSSIRSSKDVFNVMHTVPIATIPLIQNSLSRAASRRQIFLISTITFLVVVSVMFFLVRNIL